ncbi:MAG: hypothetical protein LPK07_07535 [Hymenobacteraceae bacterium]|nr:hypothetical protein [Hymenobacteraceae bacterium]
MRKYLYLLPLLFLGYTAQAQGPDALAAYNLQQDETLRIGMIVLGGWAIGNIAVASFQLTRVSRTKRHFYQMNLYWNIVNLIIAGAALGFILSDDATARSLAESVRLLSWHKKILYLGVGLDIGFIILGNYLKTRSKVSYKVEQLLGWGQSIVLQGTFLFFLDLVLVVLLELSSDQLFRLIPQV